MKKGVISNLYPTTKAWFILAPLLMNFFFDWKFAYLIVLPIAAVLALVDGKIVPFAKKVILALIVFVLFIFLFKIVLDQTSTPVLLDLGFLKVTEQALIDALNQTSLLIVLVATVLLFFETTQMEELMLALQKMKMSHMVSYIVLSTFQLIPDMTKKSKVIMQAQQARGIETEGSVVRRMKAFFPSLGPLIISSIADVEDRAVTLEVRGFSSDNKKTSLRQMEKNTIDTIVTGVLLALTVVVIVWRVIG